MNLDHSIGAEKKPAFCFTLWFRTHNNPRYADLFPRLAQVVQFRKLTLSRRRIVRGLQYRLWDAVKRNVAYPAIARYHAGRYPTVFTVDTVQIPAWPEAQRVVVDMDDPEFTPTELKILKLPQVKAIVVTNEQARTIYQQEGITCPIHIIPQGISMEQIDLCRVQEIRTQFKGDRDVVVGYHAPTLTMSTDGRRRAREGMDDLDFLFDTITKARELEPRITLWLLGVPSKSVKEYANGKSWIKLFGYVPFSEVLNYVSNFDIGAYPRTCLDPIRFRVKIAEFMGCGIPIISTNLVESFIVKEARCGIVCESREEFSGALVELARSAEKRFELGNAGRIYAQAKLDWSALVPIYKDILNGANHGG